jgi:hypothetical protein
MIEHQIVEVVPDGGDGGADDGDNADTAKRHIEHPGADRYDDEKGYDFKTQRVTKSVPDRSHGSPS